VKSCPEPGCIRCEHLEHPTAHVKYGSTVDDAHDRMEGRIP
jgi:hypothetical protein